MCQGPLRRKKSALQGKPCNLLYNEVERFDNELTFWAEVEDDYQTAIDVSLRTICP